MPTETSKVGPRADEQMSSCFLKLYTPTRVCDIYIMSCSSAHLLTLKTSSIASEFYSDIPSKTSFIRSDVIRHPLKIHPITA